MEPAAGETQLPAHLSGNTVRLYYAMDKAMMQAHREETAEGDEKAASNARILVEDAETPLLIRARACMVLGCSEKDDFLTWANEAVRTAELIVQVVGAGAGDVENALLRNCKEVLEGAQRAQAEREAAKTSEVESTVPARDGEEQKSKVAMETDTETARAKSGGKSKIPRTITDPHKTIDPDLVQDPPQPPRKPKPRASYDGAEDNEGDEEMGGIGGDDRRGQEGDGGDGGKAEEEEEEGADPDAMEE